MFLILLVLNDRFYSNPQKGYNYFSELLQLIHGFVVRLNFHFNIKKIIYYECLFLKW